MSQSDHDHVGCQHFLSKPPRAGSEAEKSRSEGVNSGSKLREALRNSLNASNLGSRKLVFLHGSKRDFIQTRVGSTLENSGHIEYVSDAVKKIPLSVSEDPQSWNREEEENHINIFHRLLFEGRIFYKSICLCAFNQLYPPTGCYDHILDRVLSLLDWTSLHCLLSAGRGLAWAEAVAQHWSSPRLGAQLLARWRSFVPAQREVRWAGTVTCMAATLAAVFAGFSSGRVVRLCRHTGGEQYSVAAHAGPVAGLAVDAAGGWLVTAGAGAVRVWRLAGGRLVCQLARAGRVAELRAERGRWGHQTPRPH